MSKTLKIGFVFGTRPEGIKLAPVIEALQGSDKVDVVVINTGQHQEILDQVLDSFSIRIDEILSVMQPNQSLSELSQRLLEQLSPCYERHELDWVVVQGDTSSTFIAGLAAYYSKIKVAHVEAGLRSHDHYFPFPEEMNRKLLSQIADIHFAPTDQAVQNLVDEGVASERIYKVGNTVVDALQTLVSGMERKDKPQIPGFTFESPSILITCHRRENIGAPFQRICRAILSLAEQYPEYQFIYPVHPNPKIRSIARDTLVAKNIILCEPLSYTDLIQVMAHSTLILTDSGGIQEEAPSLNTPVLVLREVTERQEGIDSGCAKLLGSDTDAIVSTVIELLNDRSAYEIMKRAKNPYGDGTSAKQIKNILLNK